ncbi:MAG TPA: hypothetical protein VKX24_10785 [Acidimicrobiia bacterium]|nr:hypothetical protein [Acidimicrobiia bacterium]
MRGSAARSGINERVPWGERRQTRPSAGESADGRRGSTFRSTAENVDTEEAVMAERGRGGPGAEPYEGEEAEAPAEDFGAVDPDELTGPGGRLPAVDGLTGADDPKAG